MTGYNPSFTLLEIDEETMVVVRQHTYMMDVRKANADNKAVWVELHEFTTEYGVVDMSPVSLMQLAESFKENEAGAIKYRWNESRKSHTAPTTCDQSCRTEVFCEVSTSEDFQHKNCNGKPNFDWVNDTQDSMINFLLNPWISTKNVTQTFA